MKRSDSKLKRLLLLLAASDAGPRELAALYDEFRRLGAHGFTDLVLRLRDQTISRSDWDLFTDSYRLDFERAEHEERFQAQAADVERLLRVEAGLTVGDAWHRLLEEVGSDALPAELRRIPQRATGAQFRRWLSSLFEIVPPRTVLHFASSIRNTQVHRPVGDWPLKGG